MESTRVCRCCKEEFKPTPCQFKKRDFRCNPCTNDYQNRYREKRRREGNPVKTGNMSKEYQDEYSKWYSQKPEVKRRRVEKFYERLKDPEERRKYNARKEARNARRRGDLVKKPCEVCGSEDVHAHHDNYDYPLEVRWLCAAHHSEHHKNERDRNTTTAKPNNIGHEDG